MRQRAAESDIVIVNHHLLCADASVRQSAYGEVIPDCQLRDPRRSASARGRRHAVLRHRGQQLPHRAIWCATRERLLNLGAVERLRRATSCVTASTARRRSVADVLRRARRWRARMRRGGSAKSALRVGPGWFGDVAATTALALDWRARRPRGDADAAGRPRAARDRGAASDDTKTPLAIGAPRGGSARPPAFLLRAPTIPTSCISSRRAAAACSCAPRPSMSRRIVREMLFDRMRATVLTSATLDRRGSFDYVKRPPRRRATPTELRVPSEFDFAAQAMLYLPRRMPPPQVAATSRDAVGARGDRACCSAPQGRAFVLFTSYAMLRAVQAVRRAGARRIRCSCRARRRDRRCSQQFRIDAERRAACDVELLAGRGCRRRGS